LLQHWAMAQEHKYIQVCLLLVLPLLYGLLHQHAAAAPAAAVLPPSPPPLLLLLLLLLLLATGCL
jgi:hypothetical protein